MRRKHLQTIFCLSLLTLLSSIPLFAATPVRGSSGNGANPDAASWNLLGRTQSIILTKDGKQVIMRRQIVCLKEDVEDSLPSPDLRLTGTCHSGAYIHLFQFESNSTNVTVSVRHFLADPNSLQNYGVMTCDPSNTLELCTNLMGMSLPDITVSVANNSVSFAVPAFPWYPKGIDNQGRGLTFYVIVAQKPSALPIQLPSVEIR